MKIIRQQFFKIVKTIILSFYRRVVPTVEPGYLRPLIPETAPEKPDKWEDVMSDIERVIMPGVSENLVTMYECESVHPFVPPDTFTITVLQTFLHHFST